MIKDIPVITIDGPSGAGKGEVSRLLAKELGWHFLDSGAIYRVLALVVIRKKIPQDEITFLINAAKNLDIKFTNNYGLAPRVVLDGEDVTQDIRHEECGNIASKIAAFIEVREVLATYQRSFCRSPGLVADGRDMGTVVFPFAKLKIFLTASVEERARRRLLQLQDQGLNATLGTVFADLAMRDKRDRDRIVSPLKPDADAIIVDTTKLSISEVLQQILAHVKSMQL
ncbi:MAG: (d)CMP kinase [Gammaproteobacteria bacterium]|nr:(d)CMP kinase [Gammaproteobacteria bacterium]